MQKKMGNTMVAIIMIISIIIQVINGQTNCHGSMPTAGIYTGAPVLVGQSTNGKLFTVGGEDNPVNVLHVYGTPFQMGEALGLLMKDDIRSMYTQFYQFMESEADPYLKFLPEFMRRIIVTEGIEAALEYEVLRTSHYIPQHYFDEIRGIAQAIGLSYGEVLRFMMFPELIKAACSIVGAWGPATANGGLVHLRALDWGTANPFRLYPLVTVYHPVSGNGHEFATLGWSGLIGALSGFSPYVGAGEKVWIHYNGTDVRAGIPWHFLFRDILQFDETVNDALDRITNATRTCSVFLGLGDHSSPPNFRVVEYSHDRVEAFTDTTPFPGYEPTPPEHPLMAGVAYVDKHTQPSSDPCLGSLLQKFHGAITSESLVSVTSLLQTGDMHAAIYDYTTNIVLISVASQTIPYPPPNATDVLPAYDRQFIQLDMNSLFATTNN